MKRVSTNFRVRQHAILEAMATRKARPGESFRPVNPRSAAPVTGNVSARKRPSGVAQPRATAARAPVPETLEQVRKFLDGAGAPDLEISTRADAYSFTEETARRFDYARLGKADKGALRLFLCRVTGRSRAQVTRLLRQYRTSGQVADRRAGPRRPFSRRYTSADIELLAEVDALHGTLSGPATRRLCARAFHLFGDRPFERLAGISNGHLYNLRRTLGYRRCRGTLPWIPTCPVPFVRRWRVQPFRQPGHLRVVAVRPRELKALRGLYHLELVDEVTMFRFVASVERLDAPCLAPVLQDLLEAFPFAIRSFHSGHGSGQGDAGVAALLQALYADGVARACRGAGSVPVASSRGLTRRVNGFTRNVLVPYLNYHRLRFFPVEQVDGTGRVRRCYRDLDVMTPYERLKSLPEAAACLRPGVTFARLDAVATAVSDSEAARTVNEAGIRLFRQS